MSKCIDGVLLYSELKMLDRRLALCASMVRNGSVVADIGTDHAYLPIYLVQEGKCPKAVACDLRQGPLDVAKENISRAGLSSVITTVLADGLSGISADDADDIVIAGMGGHLIAEILDAAKWVKNPQKRLILQPMTDACVVRRYLCENGFKTVSERAVGVGRHLYSVISAEYGSVASTPDELYCLIGSLKNGGEPELRYVSRERSKLEKKFKGLKAARNTRENTSEVEETLLKLIKIEREMEERLNVNG